MKVRWTSSSLRLRITPSELGRLLSGQSVRERLLFPGSGWQIEIVPECLQTEIVFQAAHARLALSNADRARLALPDSEGIYFHTDGAPALHYFIEKDYPCVHPHAAEALEPATETFEAPEGFDARKQAL